MICYANLDLWTVEEAVNKYLILIHIFMKNANLHIILSWQVHAEMYISLNLKRLK